MSKVIWLVSLVESWEDLEEYAKWCRYGSYQTRETVSGIEIRVVIGRFGYINTFKDTNDPVLNHILGFCKVEGFIKVLGNIPDDLFYSLHKDNWEQWELKETELARTILRTGTYQT